MAGNCIAFKETYINDSVAYIPCGLQVKRHKKDNEHSRFCFTHEKAYRELVLGIIHAGRIDREGIKDKK